MDPRLLGAAFRIAVLILGTALLMLPFQPSGSAEQVVTVLAAFVGALFVVTVLISARIWSGRPPVAPGDRTRRAAFNERPQRSAPGPRGEKRKKRDT